VQRLVSLPMWVCLLDSRREAELKVLLQILHSCPD
jgi:hypothetical protein